MHESPDDSPTSFPLAERAPDESFWLHELGFKEYSFLARNLGSAEWIAGQLQDHYRGPVARSVLERLLAEASEGAFLGANLVLVAHFIKKLKSAAIVDVAARSLTSDEQVACESEKGALVRNAVAASLFCRDPRSLLSVHVCDRWHAKRRCVMQVKGRAPHPKEHLTIAQVDVASAAGLRAWRGDHVARHRIKLLQVFERDLGEILVAFRRPFGMGAVRDDDDKLVTGSNDELVILRFRGHGRLVDVTATRLEEAVELAEAIGTALLGRDIKYRKRREPVTEGVLQSFLERLCEPAVEDLALVEVKAEMPGEPGCVVKTIHGAGKVCIEETLVREAAHSAFARDWKNVHHVKVRFEGYRFTVHFPEPSGDKKKLVLTYSDLDRDTGVSEKFEEFIVALRNDLGADINIIPRSKDLRVRSRTLERGRPNRVTEDHWRRLLLPSISDPLDWEVKSLESLRDDGLLTWRVAWFFRCGDEFIDRHRAGVSSKTIDCKGIVEWENDESLDDPYAGLEPHEQPCNQCNETWNLLVYRPSLHRRFYLEYDHAVVWRTILAKMSPLIRELSSSEGDWITSGTRSGVRVYLAYLPCVDVPFVQRKAAGHPVIWFAPPRHPKLNDLDGLTCDLAQIFTGKAPREAVVKRAVVPVAPSASSTPSSSPPAINSAGGRASTPRAKKPPALGSLVRVDGKAIFYEYASDEDVAASQPRCTWKVLAPHANGGLLLLALLSHSAGIDDDNGGERRFRGASSLTGLDAYLRAHATQQTFYKWVKRTRDHLDDKVAPGVGRAVIEGNDPVDGSGKGDFGYRLGQSYPVIGFQLSVEVQNWKSRREKRVNKR